MVIRKDKVETLALGGSKMSQTKKRNIIIGSLCGILLLMVVGYAAFSSVLNIKGTSIISSNWDIKITKIESKNATSGATNKEEPTGEGTLSATFNVDLKNPGDSIDYEIKVTNGGSINAKLNEINLTSTENPAIKFTVTMIKDGVEIADIEKMKQTSLKAGENSIFKVKIEFLTGVVIDEKNLSSNLTVTLDYSQADGSSSETPTPSGPSAANQLIETVVTTGDGLYADEYEAGRYVYKGANPNNYITFNNETWRIIAIEPDGTLKIMKKDSIGTMAWDTSRLNNWARSATLNTYLNTEYYNSLSSEAQALIQTHTWGIGGVTYNNTDLAAQIQSENGTTWSGNIGLMSASDAIRANTNTDQCGNLKLNYSNQSTCKTTNYIVPTSGYLWTISPSASFTTSVFAVYSSSFVADNSALDDYGVLPALYLTPNITLEGEGTETDPYTIN